MGITLAVVLATGFVLLAGWQVLRAEYAVALIAAGMAAMAIGMAFPSGHLVHGPWWAAAFAVVAIWAWRSGSSSEPSGQHHHLVGGLAMVYMCAAWPGSGGLSTPVASAALSTETHHLVSTASSNAALAQGGATPAGLALPLVGWLLACYFLLHAIGALTRRHRAAAVQDAAMGIGMTAMLLVMI